MPSPSVSGPEEEKLGEGDGFWAGAGFSDETGGVVGFCEGGDAGGAAGGGGWTTAAAGGERTIALVQLPPLLVTDNV